MQNVYAHLVSIDLIILIKNLSILNLFSLASIGIPYATVPFQVFDWSAAMCAANSIS